MMFMGPYNQLHTTYYFVKQLEQRQQWNGKLKWSEWYSGPYRTRDEAERSKASLENDFEDDDDITAMTVIILKGTLAVEPVSEEEYKR